MEESKNMSEAFRIYGSHSTGSASDKAGVGFPRVTQKMEGILESESLKLFD